MRIGLLSDTHDRIDAMSAAMELLRSGGAEYFIHCGDVGGERILDALAGLRAAFVWGNCDYDRAGLDRYAKAIGVVCLGAFGKLTLGGKMIAVLHGDDALKMRTVVANQICDYIFCGHTHVRSDQRQGKTRIINPGALHRARHKTVAILDTESGQLTTLEVGSPASEHWQKF